MTHEQLRLDEYKQRLAALQADIDDRIKEVEKLEAENKRLKAELAERALSR